MLDLLIKISKSKLEKMITKEKNYDKILRKSQKLDKLINRKMGIKNSHIFPTLVWDNTEYYKIQKWHNFNKINAHKWNEKILKYAKFSQWFDSTSSHHQIKPSEINCYRRFLLGLFLYFPHFSHISFKISHLVYQQQMSLIVE